MVNKIKKSSKKKKSPPKRKSVLMIKMKSSPKKKKSLNILGKSAIETNNIKIQELKKELNKCK